MIRLLSFLFIIVFGWPLQIYAAESFTLHTSSFTPNENLPNTYTCDGKDMSPELDWSAVPEKAKSLALIFADFKSDGIFYHWVVYNIPPSVLSFPEAAMDHMNDVSTEIRVAKNSFGKNTYNGPCPPPGETHNYKFMLYALDTILDKDTLHDGPEVMKAVEQHSIQKIELQTKYRR